ncbi:MAG: hypothetical protein MAG431_00934 [Chloroflexi bacterium]|nr:hypothetical protein [Chloroflexota bacterium]
MKRNINGLKHLTKVPWLAEALTILGGILYSVQIWIYAHSQDSLLDEGLYLLKGYLFATGKYTPFQPYGLWTNHMPLSFLIPGYVQVIFGPGLRTGRYLAIFLGIFLLLGIWILARRLGGKSPGEDASRWLAAGVVFAFALNPAVIKIYSVMASQGLAACALVWIMVLVLGKSRPPWQIILGGIMAGIIPLIRVNLVPVLPFVLAYIFWENGWRVGLFAAMGGLLSFLGGHALYWPTIMTLWVKWFPPELTPFLDTWRPEGLGLPTAIATASVGNRLTSFFEGVRFHFIPLAGAVSASLFWPKTWKKQECFRIAVFLLSLFIILLGLHTWASVGGNYCIYCFANYLAFFSSLGILLIIVSISNWQWRIPPWRGYFAFAVMVFLALGIGYSYAVSAAHGPIGGEIMDVLERKVPAVLNSQYTGLPIWDAVAKEYRWSYWEQALVGTRVILIAIGIFICLGLVALVSWYNQSQELGLSKGSIFSISFLLFLALGGLVSPTEVLGGGRHNYDCQPGVIDSYEAATDHVSKYIEAGDLLYWQGGGAQSILLPLSDINLFPPQLNSTSSYHQGGEPDQLVKYGYWNESLKQKWVEEADVLIIAERTQNGWIDEYITRDEFDIMPPSPAIGCREGSTLYLYRRLP